MKLLSIIPRAGLALLLAASGFSMAAEPDAAETRKLHAMFDRMWDESARIFPEWASFRGDRRYDDRFGDASPAGRAATDAWIRQWAGEARAIRREVLAPADRVSLDLFIDSAERQAAMLAFDGHRRLTLGSLWGFQTLLAGLLRSVPSGTPAQSEAALARLAGWPQRVEQEISWVRGGIALGWVTARPVLERSLAQIDGQIQPAAREGPFFEPFRKLDTSLPAAIRETLQQRAEVLITEQVLPAQRRLRRFIADELLPAAPAAGGLSSYPGGDQVYVQLVRDQTTTDLTPQQVHAIGLREVARLQGEIAAVQKSLKFEGTFTQFVAHLNGPQFLYASPEAMLDGYRAVAKRLDPEMPRLFATLPRAPYGVRAMPAFMGAGAADNYSSPPPDGSQPGWYNANTLAYQRRPRWALPTLVAHETVPGHHIQNARALELGNLPEFRRQGGYTAYGEGWALYAETLADRIGLFETPEDRFGYLQAQTFRAARLVVDSGLHALGWSRQQAIDYMVATVGEDPVYMSTEVDRYLSSPAQALAYMIGQLKIIELRDRAMARLGTGFDLRRFHNAVLDNGELPLTVLERSIDDWVAAQAAAR
jgi:uncharacterized protein (DUF885 family)